MFFLENMPEEKQILVGIGCVATAITLISIGGFGREGWLYVFLGGFFVLLGLIIGGWPVIVILRKGADK